jgi:hypothetical protein
MAYPKKWNGKVLNQVIILSFDIESDSLFLLPDWGFLQLPSFHLKSQVLEIHKHEKNFKVSHNRESHKKEVLAKIYFSKTE